MYGIWGGGREGHAGVSYANTQDGSQPIIVVDENPNLTWPDLPDNAHLFLGPDALPHLLDASEVIVSPGIPGVHPFRMTLSQAGIPMTSGTDLWMNANADTCIGVTGTKGKSTTTSLITTLLQRCGVASRLAGNIGIPLLSLPDFSGATVVELSSYQCHSLTQSPKVAVIVNLYQEHLTWHGSLETYWRDKCRIFTHGAQTLIADAETVVKIGSLGLTAPGIDLVIPGDEVRALVTSALGAVPKEETSLLFSSMPGVHNLTLAVCAVQAWGIEPSVDDVAHVIRYFRALPHRLSLISHALGREWYDDTLSTSAESVVAAAQALESKQRVLIVGGQSRGISYDVLNNYLLGQTDNLPFVVTMPSNGPEVVIRYEQSHPEHVLHTSSLGEAVGVASTLGGKGAAVILSPGAPSYDLYANYEAKSAEFSALVDELGQASPS